MSGRSLVAGRGRRWGSGAVVAGLAVALVAAALSANGYVRPKLDLHDAGVWVTWGNERAVGRSNTEIKQVDLRLNAADTDFDVMQNGNTVLLFQRGASHLKLIDPALGALGADVPVPSGARVAMGGSSLEGPLGVVTAVLDSDDGRLWLSNGPGAPSQSYGSGDDRGSPTTTLAGASEVTVGGDGSVHALEPNDHKVISLTAAGKQLASRALPDDLQAGTEQLAAVGNRPVVLDPSSGRLVLPGGDVVDLAGLGANLQLQESSDAADFVVVASETSLAKVPLGGGQPERLTNQGDGGPARPVVVQGCVFGAWGGGPSYVQSCPGDSADVQALPGIPPKGSLKFRVNRDRVVINETVSGKSVVVGDGVPKELDWAQAQSEPVQDDSAKEDDDEEEQTDLDRTKNDPPTANPDEVGGRANRPVSVPVLANDVDPDGDVLVVRRLGPLDAARGHADIVAGGEGVQVSPAPGFSQGSFSFDYTIDDGHGADHESTAAATVTIFPDSVNNPPRFEDDTTTVVAGSSVTHDVLGKVVDPEGDAVSLVSATAPEGHAPPQYDPSGKLTYTAPPDFQGTAVIQLVVQDQFGAQADGKLTVKVTPLGANLAPTARNDHAVTFPHREAVVPVLANDSDPNGDGLEIVRVGEPSGNASFSWTPGSKEIRVRADQPGAYDVVYEITDGQASAKAILRVDVAAVDQQQPPVAVRDDVVLRPNESRLVDVLANDVDVNGDVLIITGLQIPAGTTLSVEVLERRFLRLSSPTPLPRSVEVGYIVSDGSASATGKVVVQPGVPPAIDQPPVAVDDEVSVRAGNSIAVPVLANDRDPEGLPLAVVGTGPLDPGDGTLFLQNGELQYLAPPAEKGSVRTTYRVRDAFGQVAAANLVIHVTSPDPGRNNPPSAPDLQGRVLAGGTVTIPVPVGSIDPDGDPVTLLGLGDVAPSRGTVVEVGTDKLVYRADRKSQGTDEFSYQVRDSFGAEAIGRVLVGIAPAAGNTKPSAVADTATVKPGTAVSIPVLRNDSDLDGDELHVSEADDDQPTVQVGAVSRDGDHVVYTAPGDAVEGSSVSFTYVVLDGNGGRATGIVTVTMSKDVPNQPPIPRDDAVSPQSPGQVVTVPVLENDRDPDGPRADLRVAEVLDLPGATVVDGTKVQFTMPPQALTFRYTVTDGQPAGTAQAVVRVPLASNRSPAASLDQAETRQDQPTGAIDVLANDSDPEGASLQLVKVFGARNGSVAMSAGKAVFTPAPGFVGDAGFSYQIADGTGPDAQTAVGSVLVDVTGTDKDSLANAPTCVPRSVEVVQGNDAGSVLDLRAAVSDLNDEDIGRHTFRDLQGAGSGIDGQLAAEGTLTLHANTDAAPGATRTLTYTVEDPAQAPPATCQVLVTVIASDKPLASAVADTARTRQGEGIDIDVTANDVNPFPSTPLKVLSLPSQAGGTSTVASDGHTVRFEPNPSFFGQATFTYLVGDETGDAGRQVVGSVTVTVIGRPAAPGAPSSTGVESHTVHLSWPVPANNGAPITRYTVRASTGQTKATDANALSFDGLANNQDVSFTVVATNEAGDSLPSPVSPTVRPDLIPPEAGAPTVRFGDRQIRVDWAPVVADGSPVDHYTLRVSPPPPSGPITQQVPGTSFTWTGLENGTGYRFSVRAHNAAGDAATFGPESLSETPAGPPLPMAAPTTTARDLQIAVHWVPPNNNGDPVKSYEVQVTRNGAVAQVVTLSDGNATDLQVTTENGADYSFAVRATNKAGTGQYSPASAAKRSSGLPLQIRGAVSATEGDTTSTLGFDPSGIDNGSPVTSFQYDINGDNNWRGLAGDRVVRGLGNGASYSFRIRGVNANGASDRPPSAASNTVSPYGAPPPPTVNVGVNGTTINWSWGQNGGNGRTVVAYQFRVDGAGFGGNTGQTSHGQAFGFSETHMVCVRVVTNAASRALSAEACASQRTVNPPPPPPPPSSRAETTGPAGSDTFDNPSNAGGKGSRIGGNATIQISCRLQGFVVADGNNWWYRIESSPWAGKYTPADNFYNNGQTSGTLIGTPFVDTNIPMC